MIVRHLLSVMTTALLSCASVVVSAEAFGPDTYAVYYGDVNEDGIDDIYLKALDYFVPIHGDIVVPLMIPYGDSYLILSTGPNSYAPQP